MIRNASAIGPMMNPDFAREPAATCGADEKSGSTPAVDVVLMNASSDVRTAESQLNGSSTDNMWTGLAFREIYA
jgi:hypothetical protein